GGREPPRHPRSSEGRGGSRALLAGPPARVLREELWKHLGEALRVPVTEMPGRAVGDLALARHVRKKRRNAAGEGFERRQAETFLDARGSDEDVGRAIRVRHALGREPVVIL